MIECRGVECCSCVMVALFLISHTALFRVNEDLTLVLQRMTDPNNSCMLPLGCLESIPSLTFGRGAQDKLKTSYLLYFMGDRLLFELGLVQDSTSNDMASDRSLRYWGHI